MTRTKQTLLVIGVLLAGTGAGYGCKRTPDEAHNDAVQAQREADRQTAEARKEAAEKIDEANKDSVKAAEEARQKAAEAQANANEKIRDANRDVTGPKSDLRDWAQKKIDDVDNMIDTASAKAQTAAPKAKERFNTEIDKVKQQRDALQTEVASIDARAGDKVDKTKEDFSDRVDRIKDRIRNIEKSL